MTSTNFEQLENTLRTLGKRADLSYSKKQAIRDKVFLAIGQVELADAIVEGEAKANALFVSLKSLQKALIPHRLSFSMPVTMAVMLFVFLASVVTGAAAQGAGPSDTLFWAKRVLEKVELAFTTDPVSRAKVTINIAGERLRYLESSVGEEQTLSKVLKESQVALVDAKAALKRAQGTDADTAGLEELVNRFSALLSDQKAILDDIERAATTDDVKKTVIAIRGALADKPQEGVKPSGESVATAKPIANTITNAITNTVVEPAISGRVTTNGRIGTAYGKPVLFVGSKYYQIIATPVLLDQFIGSTVFLTADFGSEQVAILQISINGIVYGNVAP